MACAFLASCAAPNPNLELAEAIRNDQSFHQVDSMARAVIGQGLNAGSGYSQIWARDMNTFIETASRLPTPKYSAKLSSSSSRCNNRTTK